MVRDNESKGSYRCVIPVEVGAAKLKINGKTHACRVTERCLWHLHLAQVF